VNDKPKTGIQIFHQPTPKEISVVDGGIKISASEKPITGSFAANTGRIYILLDCSGSMKRSKLDKAKLGIVNFSRDALKKGYQVGLISFSDQAEHLCEPAAEIETLQKAMQGLRGFESTNMTDAIKTAHLKLKDFNSTKVMLIATDGMPDNSKSTLEAANQAKAEGIEIITIGTDDADKEFLKKLASRTELSTKVTSEKFADAITAASLLLMSPKDILPK
jgi:molecular chaperone DnaK